MLYWTNNKGMPKPEILLRKNCQQNILDKPDQIGVLRHGKNMALGVCVYKSYERSKSLVDIGSLA